MTGHRAGPAAVFAMGGTRARTPVEWAPPPEGRSLVRFDLAHVAGDVAATFGIRRRPGRAAAVRVLTDAASACLPGVSDLVMEAERIWARAGLRGAVLLVGWDEALRRPARAGLRPPRVLAATDLGLVLNVLGRAGTGLLLARAPLELHPARLGRALTTDDPRLVALARATGATEEERP